MRPRPARPLFAVLLVLLLVSGCKGNGEEGAAGTASRTPTPAADPSQPRRGGTVVVGWSAAATGVNDLIKIGRAHV